MYAQCHNDTCTPLQNEMDHEGDAKYIRGAVAKTEIVQNVRTRPLLERRIAGDTHYDAHGGAGKDRPPRDLGKPRRCCVVQLMVGVECRLA